MGRTQGINPRGNSIQIDFYYLGKRCRETLKLEPTKANLTFAQRFKASILHEIAIGTFTYSKHFPNSKNVRLGSKSTNKTDDYIRLRTNYVNALEGSMREFFPETKARLAQARKTAGV